MPIIIPIWHIGMETVLPNEPPYYFRLGKKLTYNFGKPIDLNAIMERLRTNPVTEEEARRIITDRIQEEMMVSCFVMLICLLGISLKDLTLCRIIGSRL